MIRHQTLAFALVAGLALPAAAQETVRFGAGQQGSQNYGVNTTLAQAVEERTDLSAQVQSFGGPTAYLPLLDSGELHFAAVVTPDAGDAVRGQGPFEGAALANLTLVAPLFPSPVGLMVRAGEGIDSIADLAGKRVAWGMPAQASLLPYVAGALANGGLSVDDITQVPVASVGNGVDALVAGEVDAALFALRSGKVVQADSAAGGIRWLPFDDGADAVAAMQAVAPEAYLVPVAPEDGVTGAPEPMMTMAYDYVLLAHSGVAAETVGAVAAMLRDDGAELAEANRILGEMSAGTLARDYPAFTRHPGAAGVFGD